MSRSVRTPVPRTRRPGMSIAEVLVALFIMALGTIAILTMFPLGMVQMGQALKDDRTAQSATAADGYMRWYWKKNVVEGSGEQFVDALRDPNSNVPQGLQQSAAQVPQITPGSTEPSYPVFVDPMGFGPFWGTGNPLNSQYWVGGQLVPRRTLNTVPNTQYAQRVCSLMDGFGYDTAGSGTPATNGGVVERELRYNWLWVIQRPDNSNRNTANMTVVVFDKRSFQYAPPNAETVIPNVSFSPGATSVSVPTPSGIIPQKGGWVLDATVSGTIRHAYFYRVVSATENTPGTLDIELQTPIRRIDNNTNAYTGTMIVLAGVSEVFERPALTPNGF